LLNVNAQLCHDLIEQQQNMTDASSVKSPQHDKHDIIFGLKIATLSNKIVAAVAGLLDVSTIYIWQTFLLFCFN